METALPKLLWVALPLVAAAAWLGLLMLLGRKPSRLAVNVGASVLLLGYVLATAGLGIFWVANQQLPVFDWHYLFGYGTLLLVALHLVFNFPIVWRTFVGARRGPARNAAATSGGRRGAFAALGAALAAGVAFALGLRLGRDPAGSEQRDALPPGANAADPALARVERFHALSSHSRAGVLLRAPSVDWGESPPPFKRYREAPRRALPPPRSDPSARFDVAALGVALWHTTGLTLVRGGLRLRASPSSGALYPAELYVIAHDVPGLAAGRWHYDGEAHALERLGGPMRDDAALRAVAATPEARAAAAIVVVTAVFRRTGYKYRDRTYRYVLADLGHALENLRVAGGTVGARVRFLSAFDEAQWAAALRLDESEEGVIAVAVFQVAARAGEERGDVGEAAAPAEVVLPWRPPLSAAASAPLGATATMHAATSLRAAAPAPRAVAPERARATPADAVLVLPDVPLHDAPMLEVIAKRRSVRRFAGSPLSLADLAGVLARTHGAAAPIFSPAIRIDVVAHRVAGLAPGAYRFEPPLRALAAKRTAVDLARASRAAALDQDVIGDAAAVLVLSLDRALMAADPLGPGRGYRHAFLEAGLIGERVYLEGGARRLGVCAVGAFYDDEAAALVGTDPAREWAVHFVALGIPAAA